MRRARLLAGRPFGEINVTPLIDVVMCLIVFYLMVGKLASDRRSEVRLPQSSVGQTDTGPRVLVVNVLSPKGSPGGGAAAQVVVDGAEVAGPDALERLVRERLLNQPQTVVQIRAGADLPFGSVSPVMHACTRGGAASVRLAAQRVGGTP